MIIRDSIEGVVSLGGYCSRFHNDRPVPILVAIRLFGTITDGKTHATRPTGDFSLPQIDQEVPDGPGCAALSHH